VIRWRRLPMFTSRRIHAAVARALEPVAQGADILLIAGDLTTHGEPIKRASGRRTRCRRDSGGHRAW